MNNNNNNNFNNTSQENYNNQMPIQQENVSAVETLEVQNVNPPKKKNVALSIFNGFLYIFICAFKGLKFVLIDLWVLIWNLLTQSSGKSVKGKEQNDSEFYARTRSTVKVKTREYKYSKSYLAKLEKMKAALNLDLQNAGATRSKVANVYQFTVRDPNNGGKIFKDTMGGFSKLDINSYLVNEGYEVFDIKTSSTINFLYQDSGFLSRAISVKDLVFWLTQLSTYIKAGITLSESVKILALQLKKKKRQQKIMQRLSYELSLGESFSKALEKQGNYFPPLLINMIKAAEASGTLQETLEEMAKYYTEVNNTRKDMIGALTYPVIIMVFAISVVTFIIIYVVPQFTSIYATSGIPITGLTKIIIDLSDFLSKNLIIIIVIIVLVMIIVYLAYKFSKEVRMGFQKLFMKIPVVKDVIIFKELNIFAKTFASLLRNNVFITESMEILSKITSNEIYKGIMYQTINNIVVGEKISDAFKDHWAVPDVAYYMIVTGESTGQLADMMQKVSDYYQHEHKTIVESLKSFIEPVMIVFLAVMVAMIILAVIVPMFQMYDSIL